MAFPHVSENGETAFARSPLICHGIAKIAIAPQPVCCYHSDRVDRMLIPGRIAFPVLLLSKAPMDYLIPQPIVDGSPQVFTYQVNGRRVFVKKRRRGKNVVGWLFQTIIYKLTRFLLVLPPGRPAKDSVVFEVSALRRLAELGIRVPQVLHVDKDYFVMSDVGTCLEVELRENLAQSGYYIEKAVKELKKFHDRGMAHGGAQIKNFTVNFGEIYFIDFEEAIPQKNLDKYKLRDLFLFIFSLERTGHDPDLAKICALYDGNEEGVTLREIRRALLQLRPIRLSEWSVFSKYSMRDVRSLNHLIKKAERIGTS